MESLCPEAAETIASNEDLLAHILLCMPPKSLLRFKSVSKHWLALISGPNFCNRHALQNPNSKVSAFFARTIISQEIFFTSLGNDENASGFRSKPLNFVGDPRGVEILQSCNGLLLCCSSLSTTGRYYVVNPTTSKFSTFFFPAATKSTTVSGVALAFDPAKSIHYKVVVVSTISESVGGYQFKVFLSETRSWKVFRANFPAKFDMNFSRGVHCNGLISWIGDASKVLLYDTDEHRFRTVPSPPGHGGYRWHRYFGESCGHLHLIEISRPQLSQFEVLEMEKDYSGWFVKYNVDLNAISSAFPEMVCNPLEPYYSFVVVFVDEHDSSILLHIPCKVISYNLRDKKVCDLTPKNIYTERSLIVRWQSAYAHMDTLACV